MIKYIQLKNFKAFREIDISPTYLNLFAGLNGMGKSTFLQALLLLRQSYLQNTLIDKGLLLNGDHLELGKGKDVYTQYGEGSSIIFELKICVFIFTQKMKLKKFMSGILANISQW